MPLADGQNLYLATVIDCCSRRVAGWAVADHMRTELVEYALKAAVASRGSLAWPGRAFTPTRGRSHEHRTAPSSAHASA